jgi:hypothetical protein
MALYFDGIHLATDADLEELHAEAERIGLRRCHFQNHPRHPHYDVWGAPARKLTINCTPRKLVQACFRKE